MEGFQYEACSVCGRAVNMRHAKGCTGRPGDYVDVIETVKIENGVKTHTIFDYVGGVQGREIDRYTV